MQPLIKMVVVISTCSVWLLATTSNSVYAHAPFIADNNHASKESAFEVKYINVSQTVYQSISDAAPESWIKFEGKRDQELYIQIGLPYIDRLKTYRPSVALITGHEQWARQNLIDSSEQTQIQIFDSTDVISTEVFREPSTNTKSWILLEKNISLPENGLYYLVSFSPNNREGKLWVGIGEKEAFSIDHIGKAHASIEEVRSFHEVGTKIGFLSYRNIVSFAISITLSITTIIAISVFTKYVTHFKK